MAGDVNRPVSFSTKLMTEGTMVAETFTFQAEVSKLLDIVVHALYSNKQIFLRELISNASDACDHLRYVALTQPDLLQEDASFRVILTPDKTAGILTVTDNGIGMDHDELVKNLGTIAQSGTAAFASRLAASKKADVTMIGQFGVGFYSAFMVAEKVEVITRKAGMEQGWRWLSDGQGAFTVETMADAPRGTRIVLHLREEEREYLESHRLRHIVKTYSDHIAIPVLLQEDGKEEPLNEASALWTRPRGEIGTDQYREFYHHVAHAFDDPWLAIHYKAEGAIEYTGLLFVPSARPFDLFHQDRKHHVKLYVRRVFITDDCADLLPSWLRFMKGVVDSQDLPLNVSREVLQNNPLLAKIRNGLVRRILADIKARSDETDAYAAFWNTFGAVLKEGLYEDFERKHDIIELCRFHTTTNSGGLSSLGEYIGRMKEGQEAIYYITGDDADALTRSPHLEGFRAKGIEVLLLTDPIDEFWPATISDYHGKKLVSAAHAGADLSRIRSETDSVDSEEEHPDALLDTLIDALKKVLGTAVKDIRSSDRLTESPVCLVADQNDMSLHLERLLRQHRQIDHTIPRVLEFNPRHSLIRRLAEMARSAGEGDAFKEAALLLLDQARIIDGDPLPDPAAFARRMAAMMERRL
ncbi:MAG: molecular chaperone HtpG [Rhodospirillaceae bacterium]|nr:MAG: molecular chaperone HtpG [Rhodospirillaceae bacterium]